MFTCLLKIVRHRGVTICSYQSRPPAKKESTSLWAQHISQINYIDITTDRGMKPTSEGCKYRRSFTTSLPKLALNIGNNKLLLATILVEQKFAGLLFESSHHKGATLELAIASAMYARYVSLLNDGAASVTFENLWNTPLKRPYAASFLRQLMLSKVVLKGVVRLTEKIMLHDTSILDKIARARFIAVDERGTSANVFIPVTVHGKTIIVGFQCKDYHNPLPRYKEKAKHFFNLNEARNRVWIGVTPKHAKNMQNVAIAVDSHMLVSPLYQIGMNFVPPALRDSDKHH